MLSLSLCPEELRKRRSDRYDTENEASAKKWMEEILNEEIPVPFMKSLRSGEILCQLLNKLKPGIVRGRINHNHLPYHQMENISKVC
jgi:hypothetical protein